jgi:hypothetical protein
MLTNDFDHLPFLLARSLPSAKPKLTDAERHNRFVTMAEQVGASDDVKGFEKAFQKAFKNAFEKIACRKDATRRRT